MKIKTYNQKAEPSGEIQLDEKVFGLEANEALVHQAMVTQLANERQVLAHTKVRSEVRGGGRKPWRQKGTGRARAGSNRSPIWIGGGVTFGPTKERNFKKQINKKMKQKALMMVLSDKAKNGQLYVLENFEAKEFKTKPMVELLEKLCEKGKQERMSILFVNDAKEDKAKYSIRNIDGIKYINLDNINIVDLLHRKNLVMSKAGIGKIQEKYKK